jgi:hypothetical protein
MAARRVRRANACGGERAAKSFSDRQELEGFGQLPSVRSVEPSFTTMTSNSG